MQPCSRRTGQVLTNSMSLVVVSEDMQKDNIVEKGKKSARYYAVFLVQDCFYDLNLYIKQQFKTDPTDNNNWLKFRYLWLKG